jgi:2-keto-4-pentenoate hydratase/2-oxohepta-3-ene-1,7-dioic acid hydratase in catechol pathway
MRYATFSTSVDPVPRLGALVGDRMVDLRAASNDELDADVPDTLLALVQQGADAERRARELVARSVGDTAVTVALGDVRWHAPIPRPPKNVICLGLNYVAHARESGRARGQEARIPTVPVFFTKASTAIAGPYDDVRVNRSVTTQVDWEVELAIVIGVAGRDIPRRNALQHVFGYTAVNDLSARDLQSQHLQWFKGKSLDGFCPLGPVVVTPDEFGDPQTKRISLRVNGVTKQDACTSQMIFPIAEIIHWLSRGMTLEPGDVIATGTPEGVGMGRTPQEWLQDGDLLETEIEGIGTLKNRIKDPR